MPQNIQHLEPDIFSPFRFQKRYYFILRKRKNLFQISDNISSPETFEREYALLLQIRDAYPKMIIARTKHPKYSYEEIEIYDLTDWLSQE